MTAGLFKIIEWQQLAYISDTKTPYVRRPSITIKP
jgi:hypothetical protein